MSEEEKAESITVLSQKPREWIPVKEVAAKLGITVPGTVHRIRKSREFVVEEVLRKEGRVLMVKGECAGALYAQNVGEEKPEKPKRKYTKRQDKPAKVENKAGTTNSLFETHTALVEKCKAKIAELELVIKMSTNVVEQLKQLGIV